ncbi:class I SAM-dependent methyltransferase [Aquabacterium sp.]|uniref:class I SAM-dependent methyltransferase n=1 Tax=Aquabacterium sp. TaxID=1872578 RepID=UPI0019CD321D|nr:class I SAM-dependent methyltransferase [Aquabacterium sp.]MBC7700864.1 class I SAM-dependent methyltransferase [Aquabacterium sp.]
MYQWLKNRLSNEPFRRSFVQHQLESLPAATLLLDAGCGSQQYREFCGHLDYRAQDFGQYTSDISKGFASELGGKDGYKYGKLDYIGDIWNISERDQTFDAILCTEVFEHIPFPTETIREFSRLMKPKGRLILTLPSNCLRHMDPYFFYSGFTNRYLEKFLTESGFQIDSLEPVGDYYSWIAAELARTMKTHSIFAAVLLAPALLWFMFKKKTFVSTNTLCMGYHVVATKKSDTR